MSQSIKKFYSYFRSSTAYRLRIALNLKNIVPQETVFVNLLKGEQHGDAYKAVNPAGAVPAFELEDGTILTQSAAMLEWLEENYPDTPLLFADYVLRAKVRAFANVISSEMHPINNLRVLKYLVGELSLEDSQKMQWMHHWMHKGFLVCEGMLEGQSGEFCFGNTPSHADICLVPQIYNALRFKVDMSAYPRLMAVYEYALQHLAFDAAAPEKQPDCPNPS
ncbi:MAG: maleylacetoacetate isomerase [Rickettsiales bacterium]|nr:maleylacetoacetate isomerase [Rickettsiales bacterium]